MGRRGTLVAGCCLACGVLLLLAVQRAPPANSTSSVPQPQFQPQPQPQPQPWPPHYPEGIQSTSSPLLLPQHNRSTAPPATLQQVLAIQRARLEAAGVQLQLPRWDPDTNRLQQEDNLDWRPRRSILITTWRSGSTFLGDILNALPGNYYHYEPLLELEIVQVRGPPLQERALAQLQRLLACDYTHLQDYLAYGREHVWLFTHNERLWDACLDHPHLCWNSTFLSSFCRLFPYQSMKVVRLRLKLAEDLLLGDPDGPRILLLIRDPRGTLQSRKHRAWCPGQPDCDQPSLLCADMVSDYVAAQRLAALYPTRFMALRYEDLSLDPYDTVASVLDFFGLDFHPAIKEFLDTHTKLNLGGVSSTFRNSKSAPFHWTKDLDFDEVSIIQSECTEAMSHWGYNMAHNRSHLLSKDFNPLGIYSVV